MASLRLLDSLRDDAPAFRVEDDHLAARVGQLSVRLVNRIHVRDAPERKGKPWPGEGVAVSRWARFHNVSGDHFRSTVSHLTES